MKLVRPCGSRWVGAIFGLRAAHPPVTEAVKKTDRAKKRTYAPADDTTNWGELSSCLPATYCERGAQVRFLNGSFFSRLLPRGGSDLITTAMRVFAMPNTGVEEVLI
jgi:hypothetical protein